MLGIFLVWRLALLGNTDLPFVTRLVSNCNPIATKGFLSRASNKRGAFSRQVGTIGVLALDCEGRGVFLASGKGSPPWGQLKPKC